MWSLPIGRWRFLRLGNPTMARFGFHQMLAWFMTLGYHQTPDLRPMLPSAATPDQGQTRGLELETQTISISIPREAPAADAKPKAALAIGAFSSVFFSCRCEGADCKDVELKPTGLFKLYKKRHGLAE
jgi:hypothetical protein